MDYSVKAGTRDAKLGRILDAADYITKSAEVTTSNARCSYLHGEESGGGDGIFGKLPLRLPNLFLNFSTSCL
jgi:hypothetical protein